MIGKAREIAAWSLYWLGDLCWRMNDRVLHEIDERLWRVWLFEIYQWSMRLAFRVQGNGPGPWLKADK